MIRYIILIFLLCNANFCISQNVINTCDFLIQENDTICIQSFPLFKHPKINFYKHFYNKGVLPYWGSLKNYSAEWRIIDNKLYLSNIYSMDFNTDHYKVDLKLFFGDKYQNNLVLADWYSDKFYIPRGDFIVLGQSPGSIIYDTEIELTFVDGIVIRKEIFNDNFFKSIYTEKKESLSLFIQKHIDLKKEIKSEDAFTRIRIIIQTGHSRNDFTVTSIEGNINDKSKQKIINILNKLPNFDYYRSKGKHFIKSFNFYISY